MLQRGNVARASSRLNSDTALPIAGTIYWNFWQTERLKALKKLKMEHIAARSICGIEPEKSCVGWMTVARHPKRASLVVSMNDALIPVLSQVLSRTRHLFDLHCDPDVVHEVLQSMNELQPGIYVKGRRIPGCFDHFEMAVRAILYQQTTIKEANTLAGRLAKYMGMPVETGIAGLSHAFPTAKNMVALGSTIRECLGSIGIAANYSQCLLDFAQALERGEILIGHEADPLEEIKRLQNIRNISGWTAVT